MHASRVSFVVAAVAATITANADTSKVCDSAELQQAYVAMWAAERSYNEIQEMRNPRQEADRKCVVRHRGLH